MSSIQQSIEVNVPVQAVYDELARFEQYPRFMESVVEVRRSGATRLHWQAKMSGQDMQWDSEITEQVPGKIIAWRNSGGPVTAGRIELEPAGADAARVTMTMECDPAVQPGGSEAQAAQRIQDDLVRLKKILESAESEATAGAQGQDGFSAQTNPQAQREAASVIADELGDRDGNEDPGIIVGTLPPEADHDTAWQQAARPLRMPELPDECGAQQVFERGGARPAPSIHAAPDAAPLPMRSSARAGGQRPSFAPHLPRLPQLPWLPNLFRAWEEPMIVMRRMAEEAGHVFEGFIGRPLYETPFRRISAVLTGEWVPPVDIAQRDGQVVISADLPGVRPADVRIEITNHRLVIEGDRHADTQHAQQQWRHSERSYGHFYRVIALPDGVDPDAASASMHDGILSVAVPVRQAGQQGKRIEIR